MDVKNKAINENSIIVNTLYEYISEPNRRNDNLLNMTSEMKQYDR